MNEDSNAGTRPAVHIPGEVYLVGGAVRDAMLGLPVSEHDWVVVGATAADMQRLGFRSVGRDFPVFLHPRTGEEYALARRERKSGRGHTGFSVDAASDVTLEEDLSRRDLTVNAMARAADGRLIDPFDGAGDLAARRLRHVSAAFVEDPLRVLRTARFAARFAALDFDVAPDTQALLRAMAAAGELADLVAERVWRELVLALGSDNPGVFLTVLAEAGALDQVLPELAPQWREAAAAVDRAAAGLDTAQRFACLCAELDEAAVAGLCARLRAPRRFRDLALAVNANAARLDRLPDAAAALALLERLDALRRPARLEDFTAVCASLWPRTRTALRQLATAREAARAVAAGPLRKSGLDGRALAQALREARREAIAARLRPP